MKAWIFFFNAFLFLTPGLEAAEVNLIETHLLRVVSDQVKKECPSCRVEMQIFNKKILDDIAIPDQVVADHWKGQSNLILVLDKVTRVVTVDIRWFDQLIVAQSNIGIGKKIQKNDLRFVEKDVTFLTTPYVVKEDRAIGLMSRRGFQRGQVIDESQLYKPLVIKYGQPIKLELDEGALKLTINAKAKGAGAVGDFIPVLITDTGKKVTAQITGENQARIQ